MAVNTELECKRICVLRCVYAILYSVVMQNLLLTLFLLFVNFSVFHPLAWITDTIALLLSFSTWLCLIPLISIIVIHGIFLGKTYIDEQVYHPTRFSLLCKTSLRQAIMLTIHTLIGFLTAWVYAKFLHGAYTNFYYECYENSCINEKYLFLVLNGIFAGVYYFIQERVKKQAEIVFPIVQQNLYLEIRSNLYQIVYWSLKRSVLPTVAYVVGYWLFGSLFRSNIVGIFSAPIDNHFEIFDVRLMFYTWILTSKILSNMRLMDFLFTVFLTEYKEFPIVEQQCAPLEQRNEITLVDALAASKSPIVQQLASLDLYTLAQSNEPTRRTQIYALSIPGGHPYNWNALSGQCLSLLNAYRAELAKSVEHIQKSPSKPRFNVGGAHIKPSATEMAEKIRFRQYNESYGIRNMNSNGTATTIDEATPPKSTDPCQPFYDALNAAKLKILNLPGIHYLFFEKSAAKLSFLLGQFQTIVWTSQGLAALAARSINEDKYGVVQNDLAAIIKCLLQLKETLALVSIVCASEQRKQQQRCVALQSAVKMSLYNICTVFADFLPDMVSDATDLRTLQGFVNFREV